MVTPRITEQDKQSETNIRYHVLKRVKNFIQPLPIHFEVERRLSTLIRRGYLARNPLDKTFLERIRVLHQLREDEEEAHKYIDERLNYIRSTADSLSIIGISGIGKQQQLNAYYLCIRKLLNTRLTKDNRLIVHKLFGLKSIVHMMATYLQCVKDFSRQLMIYSVLAT